MSEGNGKGIIKLGKIGMRQFQYDDDTPVENLDVILVSNQWAEIDQSFRDEKGEVPREKHGEYAAAQQKFAADLLKAPNMSIADAMHFMKRLTDEAEKLKPFFALDSEEKPSSPESTVVTFSE